MEVEYNIRATVSGPLSSSVFTDIPIRIVNFASLDTPPSHMDPDIAAGATSLRTRYHTYPEARNYSTDEQLDGKSFGLGRPSGPPGPSTSSPLSTTPGDYVDSDAEINMVVRKASAQHPEASASTESISTEGPRTPGQNPGRARSKTIASIPQSHSSLVESAQDKPLHTEVNSGIEETTTPTNPGSYCDIATLTPSSSLTAGRQPLPHPSTSQPPFDSTPKELTMIQAPSTPGRVQSAPVRREVPPDESIRPNAGRSQSDTAVRGLPSRAGPDKSSDVRKRVKELEARMRGDTK